jgi:hypothetical protein
MNRPHWLPSIILLAILASLSACVPSTTTPTPTPCPPITSVEPQVFSPTSELVPSLQPTFQWFYEACADTFILEVALDGDFNAPGVIQEQVPGTQTTWTLTQTLQPASMYQWRVHATVGFGNGPYSPTPWFWTGPICDASIPDIPELVSPILGEIVTDASPPLEWSYPDVGCLPEGYQFEVSEQSDFQQTVLSGSSSSPYSGFETNIDFLQDCTDYYWRVAVLYNASPGMYSDIGEFSTDFQGNCQMATLEGIEIYAIGCIGDQSMMISFEFPDPPDGIYEAHAGENVYACERNDQRPRLLHCSGPRTEIVSSGLVELVMTETEEIVYSGEERFPNCEERECNGLSFEECTMRSDCEWVRGITGLGGFCKDR